MAFTKALSLRSCVEPDLPGFRNSRSMRSTAGGACISPDFSCAAVTVAAPSTRHIPSKKPDTFFMDWPTSSATTCFEYQMENGLTCCCTGKAKYIARVPRRVAKRESEVKRVARAAEVCGPAANYRIAIHQYTVFIWRKYVTRSRAYDASTDRPAACAAEPAYLAVQSGGRTGPVAPAAYYSKLADQHGLHAAAAVRHHAAKFGRGE